MRLALVLVFASACAPRLALTVRRPARVSLGPIKRLSILTFDTRLGVVMRERLRFELAKDAHFTLVPMCGARSCEAVDGFLRLYERDVQTTAAGVTVFLESSVVTAEGAPVSPARVHTRSSQHHGEPPEKLAERLALELTAELGRELRHPTEIEWLELDDGAPFKLGVAQTLDGRLDDARRTFETVLANNPRTAGACFNLAVVLEALGQHALARGNYQCAASLTHKAEYEAALAAFERRQQQLRALER